MRAEDPLVAARSYINAGVRVLLTHGIDEDGCCTCGHASCQHPGKHPLAPFFPHGAKSATSDISLIRRGLRTVPDANIAIALNNLTVVDIDGPIGREAVKKISLPKTIGVKTSRGTHLYFDGSLRDGSFKANQMGASGSAWGADKHAGMAPHPHLTRDRIRCSCATRASAWRLT
jgi:hypothetical protein